MSTDDRPATPDAASAARHFERLFSLSLDMICVAGTDGYFKLVNPAFTATLGYSESELLARPYLDIVHPDDVAASQAEVEKLASGESTVWFENRCRHRNGTYRWLAWQATPVAAEQIMYAVARDITQQKETEELLRQVTTLQTAILNSANYSIISAGSDGLITTFNATAERWLGYRAEEVIGRATPEIFHDSDEVIERAAGLTIALGETVEPGIETFVALARRGGVDEGEWTYVRKDGSRFPVHLSVTALHDPRGEITGYLGIASDLTEKRKAAERERRLLDILEATPDLVGIADPEGRVIYLNSAGKRHLGLAPEDDPTRWTIEDFHPPAATARIFDEALPAARRVGVWTGETLFRTLHGDEVPFSLILIAHREGGDVRCYSTVARDISEVKRQQEELATARDAALEASRLKSQFVANMSHELRTPLNSIIGFSELLLDRVPGELNAEQERCLTDVLESGRHLLALINAILDLSKIEAGKMELSLRTFELEPVVAAAVAAISPTASPKGLKVSHSLRPGVRWARGDPGKVRQVLDNLLANAVKFTDQGAVTVTARPTAAGPAPAVAVTVADTGIGMTPDEQRVIFEEFRQVDASLTRRHEGTGLGLTLCRNFVHLMDGQIWVESAPGEGSRITFTLPLADSGDEP